MFITGRNEVRAGVREVAANPAFSGAVDRKYVLGKIDPPGNNVHGLTITAVMVKSGFSHGSF